MVLYTVQRVYFVKLIGLHASLLDRSLDHMIVHCKYILSIYRRYTVKRRYGTANDSALSLAVGCYCQGTGTIQLMTVEIAL